MGEMSWLRIELPFMVNSPVLAVGTDMKSSLCFIYKRSAFLSGLLNDLQVPENLERFKRRLSSLKRRFGLTPRIIAYDRHPDYLCTRYILSRRDSWRARFVSVQHHHAHIASCMLENGLANRRVIGVAFDGTGFGDDGCLWGAEFLIADYRRFRRVAHLRYVPLLGGEIAILQPWRVTAAWLYLALGRRFLDLSLSPVMKISKKHWVVLESMWRHNFNSPLSSSMGRLFDAMGGLLLGIRRVGFEAEAAVRLERLAAGYKSVPPAYRFRINRENDMLVIDPALTFRQIVTDLQLKHSAQEIAARFHSTVGFMLRDTCLRIRQNSRINTVVLSGGVFQNGILLELSLRLLREAGFCVFTHRHLPCSDVSISLGQAIIGLYAN